MFSPHCRVCDVCALQVGDLSIPHSICIHSHIPLSLPLPLPLPLPLLLAAGGLDRRRSNAEAAGEASQACNPTIICYPILTGMPCVIILLYIHV